MKSKKRALFVTTGLGKAGAEKMLVNVLSYLCSRECPALVISIRGPNRWSYEMEQYETEVIIFTHQPFKFFYFISKLIFSDIRTHYLFIHGWMYHGNILATLLWFFLRKRVPLFWSVRQSLSFWPRELPLTKLAIFLNKFLSIYPKYISFNSLISMNQHILMGFCSVKCCYLPNVFYRRSITRAFDQKSYRKRFGIPEEAFVFGMFSRLHPVKDHKTCIDACLAISKSFPNCYFLFAGSGVSLENPAFSILASSEIQNDKFLFLGERDDIAELMNSIDCLLLSSLAEGSPNIVGEAVIMMKPFISTSVGDAHLFCVMTSSYLSQV